MYVLYKSRLSFNNGRMRTPIIPISCKHGFNINRPACYREVWDLQIWLSTNISGKQPHMFYQCANIRIIKQPTLFLLASDFRIFAKNLCAKYPKNILHQLGQIYIEFYILGLSQNVANSCNHFVKPLDITILIILLLKVHLPVCCSLIFLLKSLDPPMICCAPSSFNHHHSW